MMSKKKKKKRKTSNNKILLLKICDFYLFKQMTTIKRAEKKKIQSVTVQIATFYSALICDSSSIHLKIAFYS